MNKLLKVVSVSTACAILLLLATGCGHEVKSSEPDESVTIESETAEPSSPEISTADNQDEPAVISPSESPVTEASDSEEIVEGETETASGNTLAEQLTAQLHEPSSYDELYTHYTDVTAYTETYNELLNGINASNEENQEIDDYAFVDFSDAVDGTYCSSPSKTDGTGEIVAMLCGNEAIIFSADGGNSVELSRIEVGGSISENFSGYDTPEGLFIFENNLYVLTYENAVKSPTSGQGFTSIERTHVKCYDISDTANPTIVSDFAQDGRLVGIIRSEELLYLISSSSISSAVQTDASSFVPSIMHNGEDEILSLNEISVTPFSTTNDYTLISCYDLLENHDTCIHALTGYYAYGMYADNTLFLVKSATCISTEGTALEDQYTVDSCALSPVTNIAALSAEQLDPVGTISLNGYLPGRESIWYSDGQITAACLISSLHYRVFTDPKYGFTNYITDETENVLALCHFNSECVSESPEEYVFDVLPCRVLCLAGSIWALQPQDGLLYPIESYGTSSGVSFLRLQYMNGLYIGFTETDAGYELAVCDFDNGTCEIASQAKVSEESVFYPIIVHGTSILVQNSSSFSVYNFSQNDLIKMTDLNTNSFAADTEVLFNGDIYFCNTSSVIITDIEWSKLGEISLAFG